MSKDKIASGLKSFGKLRFKVNHSSVIAISALILILFIAFTIRILPMRWEIASGTIHLNEFDPYYQYSITNYMVQHGLFSPYTDHWINYQQWYPGGLDMSNSLPALPMTAAALYQVVSFLGINVDLMAFCSVLTVVLGTLSVLLIYFIGKDMGGRALGLFAALFLALAPSFLQRSSLGFFDTEIPGVLGLLLFILLFLRSMDSKRSLRGSLIYSVGAALALAYFIAGWGAAYYILDLTALFAFVLVMLKRYDQRLLINYSVTMGLGLLIATQVPYIGLSYLTSAPMVPVAAVFIVLLVAELLRHNVSAKTKTIVAAATMVALVAAFAAIWLSGDLGRIAEKFFSVIDPFTRAAAPLIASVAEHRISAWGNLYYELGIGVLFFLVGLYFILKNPTNRNVFMLIFGATGLYFGASMVRLLVIFAPAFALLMGIGVIGMLKPFMTLLKETPNSAAKAKRKLARVSKEYSGLGILLIFIIIMTQFAFTPQTGGMPRVYDSAYVPTSISSASLPIIPNDQVPQWLNMLSYTKTNLNSSDVVVAWWDYGYWLSVMGNVTTLADNATVNATQIQNIGFAYMGTEEQALKMLSTYGQERVKYILVFTTLAVYQPSEGASMYYSIPYGLGDEGKWMWMARISGDAQQRLIDEGFMDPNAAWTDEYAFGNSSSTSQQWEWNDQGKNTTIYKLLTNTEHLFTNSTNGIVYPTSDEVTLKYFEPVKVSGTEITNPLQYGGLIPLVALYKINWDAYNTDYPTS
ncbi:MAG: STT3 domain-containing protein [Candidatus Bathyarchaeia archaeon]